MIVIATYAPCHICAAQGWTGCRGHQESRPEPRPIAAPFTPYTCPVCAGSGQVSGFSAGTLWSTKPCHPCAGRGIVWGPPA